MDLNQLIAEYYGKKDSYTPEQQAQIEALIAQASAQRAQEPVRAVWGYQDENWYIYKEMSDGSVVIDENAPKPQPQAKASAPKAKSNWGSNKAKAKDTHDYSKDISLAPHDYSKDISYAPAPVQEPTKREATALQNIVWAAYDSATDLPRRLAKNWADWIGWLVKQFWADPEKVQRYVDSYKKYLDTDWSWTAIWADTDSNLYKTAKWVDDFARDTAYIMLWSNLLSNWTRASTVAGTASKWSNIPKVVWVPKWWTPTPKSTPSKWARENWQVGKIWTKTWTPNWAWAYIHEAPLPNENAYIAWYGKVTGNWQYMNTVDNAVASSQRIAANSPKPVVSAPASAPVSTPVSTPAPGLPNYAWTSQAPRVVWWPTNNLVENVWKYSSQSVPSKRVTWWTILDNVLETAKANRANEAYSTLTSAWLANVTKPYISSVPKLPVYLTPWYGNSAPLSQVWRIYL